MATLGKLAQGSVVTTFNNVDPQLFNLLTGNGLVRQPAPLDIPSIVASVASAGVLSQLGPPNSIIASCEAWTNQDDDAHETCSLTACRSPLHPGPCKGWKHTLHSVSPGAWHQLETERVRKANDRRLKRIADLRSQNKPIPRRLLTEIKPKPAPGHPAHGAQPVPLGQVGQKADLAGGQAHHAGQAVSKAAGVTVKTAPPLPLGPKGKKPSVSGRGPAFVITQPKVTDTYKLDKAAKITPQEWASLSDADKTTIRNELVAIKARGFGPQQKKADELLVKLPAPGAAQPSTPNTPSVPSPTPGKVSLGQAVKNHPAQPGPTPQAPAAPNNTPKAFAPHVQHARAVAGRALGGRPTAKVHLDTYGKLTKDEFDSLDSATQRTIRDDLANAKAKFLDPKKQQAAADLLDRFGSRHTSPAAAPAAPTAPGSLPDGYQIVHVGMGYGLQRNGKTILTKGRRNAAGRADLEQFAKSDAARLKAKSTPAAPTGSKIFTATHNGKTVTRTSSQPYTHASVVRWSDGSEEVASFHTSENAALKGVLTAQQKQNGAQVIKAVAVKADDGHAPNAPHSKGYSDPMAQAVKAAHGADTDESLKRIGALSPTQVAGLDDADRKTIAGRLDFIAAHPKATPQQKDRAAAYKRIIEHGSTASSTKRDHEPSLAELHADEQKATGAAHPKAAAALAAADATNMPPADRVTALAALDKAQFDSLKPDEQRKVTDALQGVHHENSGYGKTHDATSTAAGEAVTKYTGHHPAIARVKQAEADYQAGKLDARGVTNEVTHARVQAPYADKSLRGQLQNEEQRVAEDNPTLPLWARVDLLDNKYSAPGQAYSAIGLAGMEHNWKDAPRLSQGDMSSIFGPTRDDLKSVHPIQAEAVTALREHLIRTGLGPGSPWSSATKEHLVNNALHISYSDHVIPSDRMDEFHALPSKDQMHIRRALADRIFVQTDPHAKTGTNISLRQLQGHPYSGVQLDAALKASDKFATHDALDTYRSLDPSDFRGLPIFTRDAIDAHLDDAQQRAERRGAIRTFTPQTNALKEFPAALKAHLNGTRDPYADRRLRNAADIAQYGTGIINPYDRTRVYADVSIASFKNMSAGDQRKIVEDLDKIAGDTSLSLPTRFNALYTKDLRLAQNTNLSVDQIVAVGVTNPTAPQADNVVVNSLGQLGKADYDSLDRVYRDAIDERIKGLLGPQQQALNAQFHPAAPQTATPAGYTPTSVQSNVPPHVQAALDTIYGTHSSGKSHTMAHQLSTYGALRGSDFAQLNGQEQGHLLADLSFIATTAKGPSADKARKLIDRFTPPGTPAGHMPTGAVIPPVNSVPGQVRYATPLKGLEKAKDSGKSGDGWISLPNGGRVWGAHGAAGLMLMHQDPQTGEKRYLMVQRGPAISDPGKWTFPGGAIDSKETPHQGAARETIEELGLKDDVLKDALVHGDHTFTVPGSTWKYTTVAAQVPTMIKPNLSTAHARAETSDAKWMTEAEIKALDNNGELHHPIAGGKLEQNVLSLYPQAGTQTLGQIVRPGPVTKRPGRLHLPSGGRQAPSTFNAWPHPHKQSKGKDLIPDQTAFDAQRQKIKQDRKLYDGKTADGRLAAIGAQQGYDDTPTVADRKEIDRLLATGDYIEAWRGVSGSGGGWSARSRGGSGGKTATQINEEMRTGPAYYGRGIFGNGYYLATNKRVAEQYSDQSHGSLVRILIPKTAVTEKYDKVSHKSHANPRLSKAKGAGYGEESTFYDPGRYAAAKGIDGIEIEPHHQSPSGGAGHVAKHGQPAFNWLNRSVLIIQKEPG